MKRVFLIALLLVTGCATTAVPPPVFRSCNCAFEYCWDRCKLMKPGLDQYQCQQMCRYEEDACFDRKPK